jgi:hypothetical protein
MFGSWVRGGSEEVPTLHIPRDSRQTTLNLTENIDLRLETRIA